MFFLSEWYVVTFVRHKYRKVHHIQIVLSVVVVFSYCPGRQRRGRKMPWTNLPCPGVIYKVLVEQILDIHKLEVIRGCKTC